MKKIEPWIFPSDIEKKISDKMLAYYVEQSNKALESITIAVDSVRSRLYTILGFVLTISSVIVAAIATKHAADVQLFLLVLLSAYILIALYIIYTALPIRYDFPGVKPKDRFKNDTIEWIKYNYGEAFTDRTWLINEISMNQDKINKVRKINERIVFNYKIILISLMSTFVAATIFFYISIFS